LWITPIIAVALLFKSILVSGGDVLLSLGLSLLAILYYPLGLFVFNSIKARTIFKREAYKGITFLRGFGAVAAGIVFSILISGIQFKFLLLPGAGVMLGVGLAACGVLLVILLIKYILKNTLKFYKQMLVRTIIIGIFGCILFLTPGTELVKFFHRDHPGYVKAFIESAENPKDENLQKKLDEEFEKMNNSD